MSIRINGVWNGPKLSNIQKLSIRSFQDFGHEVHLYISEPTEGIPSGTIVHDAKEVLPPTTPVFTGANFYSDYFRAVLIHAIGGWYVDLDEVCLKIFDFEDPYVFVSEVWQLDETKTINNGCIFKAPAGCPFLKSIIEKIESTGKPPSWVSFGPELFTHYIPAFGLEKYVQPPHVFDPLRPERLPDFVSGCQDWDLSKAYALHLRTSYWTGNPYDPNGAYHGASLFEKLKRQHNVLNE